MDIQNVNDWLVTVPKTTRWDTYQEELNAVVDGQSVINYRTRYFPKEMKTGDRCFILWNGRVRGWMKIVGLWECNEVWTCQTTGAVWQPGKYIQRSGPFYAVEGPEMQGFRGVRKYKHVIKKETPIPPRSDSAEFPPIVDTSDGWCPHPPKKIGEFDISPQCRSCNMSEICLDHQQDMLMKSIARGV
jgi:hypothetical protein